MSEKITTRLRISDITIGDRFRKDIGDLDGLAESMKRGLLHPPVVTSDRHLVVGFRRLKAAEKLGWKQIDVRVIDPDDLLLAEHDENELRKNFTDSERVAIADAIQERIGKRQGKRTDKEPPHNRAEVSPETREKAAKAAGFENREAYRRAKTVVVNGAPELVEALDKGEVSRSAAAEVARLPRDEQREVLKKGPEAVAEKAKEIRDTPKTSQQYPHSERFRRWLERVGHETEVIDVQLGGIRAMLAESEKWNHADTRQHVLPMLKELLKTITEYHKEIKHAASQS